MSDALEIRCHGKAHAPTLVYLPGLHGDWTLVGGLRHAVEKHVRFIEFTYPRTTSWSLADYADAVIQSVSGVHPTPTEIWLLGESFGSQVAWAILENSHNHPAPPFQGVILAGGFVEYPWKPAIPVGRRLLEIPTIPQWQTVLRWFCAYVKWRTPPYPNARSDRNAFVARRTEADRQAALHRLNLILHYNPQPIARQTRIPVLHLAGFFDPIVPWPAVRRWLRRHCPGFRHSHILPRADHNVLNCLPDAADIILGAAAPSS